MTRKNMWLAGVATPVMIAMLMLFAAPPGVSAVAGNDKSAAGSAAVQIDNFVFGPQSIKVPVGTTVTWTNRDDIPHTVVSTDGLFKSKALDTEDKFTFTPTKPGTYKYYCSIHPKMTAELVVE
jgi:plastocyanin